MFENFIISNQILKTFIVMVKNASRAQCAINLLTESHSPWTSPTCHIVWIAITSKNKRNLAFPHFKQRHSFRRFSPRCAVCLKAIAPVGTATGNKCNYFMLQSVFLLRLFLEVARVIAMDKR